MSDTSLPVIVRFDTTANRMAFTPSPGVSEQLYIWLDSDDQPNAYYWDGAAWQVFNAGGGSGIDQLTGQVTAGPGSGSQAATINKPYIPFSLCQGRLTTESGVPVSTSDRTSQGTIYWTPYLGNQLGLYTGSAWVMFNQAEISLALSGLTSDKNYDVFIDYNSGTPQLVLSAAWTNDTTRADALALQDGIYVKSGSTTLRWVGTIRTTGTTTTEDSAAKRFVWNQYNRVQRILTNPTETTNSWTYNSATWRQANANTANKFEYVTGDAATFVDAQLLASTSSDSTQVGKSAIGVDSTSSPSGSYYHINYASTSQLIVVNTAIYRGTPGLGLHFLAWIESCQTANSTLFFGDDGGNMQAGLYGSICN